MRNILIDHARMHSSEKRGSGAVKLPISVDLPWLKQTDEEMLDLMRALDRLEQIDPRKARLIELRYLLSFTIEEAADVLAVSRATAERDVKFARSWLYREFRGVESGNRDA